MSFQPQDKNARKFTCFCCARQYLSFEQYSEHIVTEHTVGRDYVLCEVEWCRAPVRDLKMHYKAQHKGEPIPTKQMRAVVWKDPNPNTGKMKARSQFRKGYYVSSKTGKAYYYRSSWEESIYECLDNMPEVMGYEAEGLQIEYYYDGAMHKYIPDLAIMFTDGHKEVWEIKPSDQTSDPVNLCKFAAAKDFCHVRGWHFQVITEKQIREIKEHVMRV
jgi:hypothetical protein